ncbi:MAG: ethylbenzene dehydrogenase-related protein [Planctomycetota bacterium]
MSRRTIFIVCAVFVALFGGLVYYGWTYRWGAPSQVSVQEPPVLAMPRLDSRLTAEQADFEGGPWQRLEPLRVPLLHQVTTAPRGLNLVPELRVRAFHDGHDAYFLLEWDDEAESRVHETARFPDAVAVSFLLAEEPPEGSIMMGFQSLMNMWHWKADLDAARWGAAAPPAEPSPNSYYDYLETADIPTPPSEVPGAATELLAARAGSLTDREDTQVSARGQWRDGRWRVLFKRALRTGDAAESVQFAPGERYMAFAAWNGEKGDRGSRKSISDWVALAVGAAANKPVAHNPGHEEPRLINVLARRFEYEPAEITLRKGELVTLRLESADVTHGLYLDGYGIDIKARPGKVGKATFRADKGGRFSFRCSETCGEFHPYMIGFLTVEPNTPFGVFVVATLGACALIVLAVGLARPKVRAEEEGGPDD